MMANSDCLAAVGFPDRRANPPPRRGKTRVEKERAKLLWNYLTDGRLFDRGRKMIWVDPTGEGEALAHLQAELRRKLGTSGIVVEVNPSSNLLIGDLEDLTNHPMWRLRPPRRREEDPPPVGVCIGSDDPVTFNCNLRQEYQCLLDAMLLGGLSDDQASQWLEQARLCTLDHRFTIQRKIQRELTLFKHISTDTLDA